MQIWQNVGSVIVVYKNGSRQIFLHVGFVQILPHQHIQLGNQTICHVEWTGFIMNFADGSMETYIF